MLRCLRFTLYLTCAVFASLGVSRFCHQYTHGFVLQKIFSALEPSPLFTNPSLSETEQLCLQNLFGQSFSYLGKGAQSYVFASEDGQTVIKFFRFDHLRVARAWKWLRFPLGSDYEKERIIRVLRKRTSLENELASYQIAFDHLKEETGLLYLQLNKRDFWKQTLTLYDNIKIRYFLPLDRMEFLVQKRATLIYPTLDRWMELGEEEKAKAGLTSILELIVSRYKKGVFDKDPKISTNFGFLGTSAIQIDAGRFSIASQENPLPPLNEELERITKALRERLHKHYPSLALHVEKEITRLNLECSKW